MSDDDVDVVVFTNSKRSSEAFQDQAGNDKTKARWHSKMSHGQDWLTFLATI